MIAQQVSEATHELCHNFAFPSPTSMQVHGYAATISRSDRWYCQLVEMNGCLHSDKIGSVSRGSLIM